MTRAPQILAALRARLRPAEALPGTRVPPERVLAAELGCSRETLRRALAEMERAGEIWRHVGQGTFLGPRPPSLPQKELIVVEGASALQLMRARLVLEPPVSAEAAMVAEAAQIRRLEALVAQGRRAPDRAAAERLDAAFHRALAEVTGNPVLLALLDYLSGIRRRAIWQREWEMTYRRLGVGAFTGAHADQHQAVVQAIGARAPAEAAEAMRRHLQTVHDAMAARAMAPPPSPLPFPSPFPSRRPDPQLPK